MQEIEKIICSRKKNMNNLPSFPLHKKEEEGGCGVIGLISSYPIKGNHIFTPSVQMHNRGNGKGGGIAATGLCAEDLGIDQEILDNNYLLQIALLDIEIQSKIEEEFIKPYFDINHQEKLDTISDYREIDGLENKPPDICRYFVKVKKEVLEQFIKENNFQKMTLMQAEDEFVYQNSFRINTKYYASLGEKKAFVLSHGKNIMILKIVGYAEQVIKYYKLENFKAHIWIAHQRYPTKGRVWHPGGAHPFIGLNEALVHNGDFANYYSTTEYLKQRNIYPLFLTDTEVSVLLFDFWHRTCGYPLEYIIEALAPTTERDFDILPEKKQKIYKHIQSTHIHGSPDGPWFFIIARTLPEQKLYQLVGITDTAMLRPQVFAIQKGKIQIGLIGSEKQAIDAALESLSSEDKRICPIADKYWNARGGSYTDGGSFIFTVDPINKNLICQDKFGKEININKEQVHCDFRVEISTSFDNELKEKILDFFIQGTSYELFEYLKNSLSSWGFYTFRIVCEIIVTISLSNKKNTLMAIEVLTLLYNRRFATGNKKRSSILQIIIKTLYKIFSSVDSIEKSCYKHINWVNKENLSTSLSEQKILVINAFSFPPEGKESLCQFLVKAYKLNWKEFIIYNLQGQRFLGAGFGANTHKVKMEIYGSSGDYISSGIDGMEIKIYGNGQDQLAQIIKAGKLVIYGDVGQTFLYGAKGGEVYVLGNTAGRPLINAVGSPRVIINGTSLDYLAESFMAGDPLNNGGFVVVNALEFDDEGKIQPLAISYPGSNLFSLASGGAIYIRDPEKQIVEEQLNGGEIVSLEEADWQLILPYLKENENLFGISVEYHLLKVNGEKKTPQEIYRKIRPLKKLVLQEIEDAED
ncbi:MAG: glutamate synthase [bacterium]